MNVLSYLQSNTLFVINATENNPYLERYSDSTGIHCNNGTSDVIILGNSTELSFAFYVDAINLFNHLTGSDAFSNNYYNYL